MSIWWIFSLNRSLLLRKRIIEVFLNHLELQISSNSWMASCMRLTFSSSYSFMSYSFIATQNMIAVTSWQQCAHFLRSDLWPPTSTIRKCNSFTSNSVSWIPVVRALHLNTSSVEGTKLPVEILSILSITYLAESGSWNSERR